MINRESDAGQSESGAAEHEKPPFNVEDIRTANTRAQLRQAVNHWQFERHVPDVGERYTMASVRATELGFEDLAAEFARNVFVLQLQESSKKLDRVYGGEQAQNEKLIKELAGMRAELKSLNSVLMRFLDRNKP